MVPWKTSSQLAVKQDTRDAKNVFYNKTKSFTLVEVTSTPPRPVDNVVIATKGLQDRNTNIIAGTTVENKGKLILTEIFPSVQKHDIF